MTEHYKLIPEISPNERNWQAKVIVAEKLAPKQARNSNSRYQNLVLMDFQGNKVHATLYDGNINAFEDQLILIKTYIVSNALVKDTKPEYKAANGDIQWTITGKTRIQEVNENNMEFLFSTYSFTPFEELGNYMDCNNDISILAVAIDMRPKRLIQTRYGNQTYVQDIVLIDKTFHSIILTMWDTYVEKECITLAEKIANKPVILANRLKVSSFNGLTLSTKINSTFFIDGGFNQVAEFRAWVEAHAEELNEITLEKPSLALTPTKLSPPMHKKFTQIHNIKGRLLGRKYFWIKAKSTILAKKQAFWYMSCSNCNKVSHAEFGETFPCVYCKYPSSKAMPRANANVQLEDTSGILIASAIGSPAETLLKCDAETLISSNSGCDPNIDKFVEMDPGEHLFYVKVTQLEPNTTEYKYEIVFVLDPSSTLDDETEEASKKNKAIQEEDKNFDDDMSPPSAKRSLFQTSTKTTLAVTKIDNHSSHTHKIAEKGKQD